MKSSISQPFHLSLPWPLFQCGVLTTSPAASVKHIQENVATAALTDDEMDTIQSIIEKNPVAGERYHPRGMKHTNL